MGNTKTNNTKRRRMRMKIALFARQRGRCQYCGNVFAIQDLTFDHVVRVKDGGAFSLTNLVLACLWCNRYRESPPGANMSRSTARHREILGR